VALLAAMLANACGVLRPGVRGPLVPLWRFELPAFSDDLDLASLRDAVERSLPAYTRAGEAAAAAAAERLVAILEATPEPRARRTALAQAFQVVRVRDRVLLTAYYEPEIEGRLERDATFTHPLYARPPDLVDVEPHRLDPGCGCRKLAGQLVDGRLVPYLTRGEIDAGALAGRGLELAWTADPLAVFFLQIQGSGRLRLPDGRQLGLRFAGTNGRPYRSLARTMIERGLLARDHASVPDIRRALGALSPAERVSLLATNERYTFFRIASGAPIGSLGVELTPGRSVATDPRVVRPGALAYLVTPSVRRFVVAQDTGAAIVGARADLFLGAGVEAEERAGRMREQAALYVLLPKDARP
jgi:membrane-bound lytic murein transglycosylase A